MLRVEICVSFYKANVAIFREKGEAFSTDKGALALVKNINLKMHK